MQTRQKQFFSIPQNSVVHLHLFWSASDGFVCSLDDIDKDTKTDKADVPVWPSGKALGW